MNLAILIVVFIVCIIAFFKKPIPEPFTEITVLPLFKNSTPQEIVNHYGGIDAFARLLIKYKIPTTFINNVDKYPGIASYIHTQTSSL